MLSALVLDALLIVILLMMIPLGFLRGGLREVCTAAGLLFGILLAEQWSASWASRLSGPLNLSEGACQFLISVAVVVLSGALIGYGGSAAFSYRPGPGGRMYGAYIALFNGVVLAGYLINTVVTTVYDGVNPEPIEQGFVSRALAVGFGWVLLIGALGVLVATVFGMFVRERPGEGASYAPGAYAPQQTPGWQLTRREDAASKPQPVVIEQETESMPSAPVRIREVRHWEETADTGQPPQGFGSGWRQTWPNPKGQGPALPWEQQPDPKPPSPRRVSGTHKPDQPRESKPSNPRDVLRDWMNDEDSGKTR